VVTIVIEIGGIRFTRWGYRCRSCRFNFRFDLTSPVTECPECGSIINDRGAYYLCRAIRGLSVAFSFTLILFIPVLLYTQDKSMQMQENAALIAMVALGLLTVIFIYKQMWSLIISRIIYRGMYIIVAALLLVVGISGILSALRIYRPNNTLVVAGGLILGIILTLASYIIIKLNRDTYEYVEDQG
jgi:hypothetical protein